jgi:diguanylate cyclase (GGDEF)-like protein
MKIVRYIPVFTCLSALVIALLGLTVIIGWYTRIVFLIQVYPAWVPMQFNTALGFVCLGVGLLSLQFRYPTLAKLLALLILMLGGLTLSEYLTGISWGIDQLFMKHYITVNTIFPGRMAPNTAICFTLSGIGLMMLIQGRFYRWFPGSAIVGALIMGLGTVAFLGYISQVEAAYGWGQWTRMAIHTAIGFIIVGLTIVLHEQHIQYYFSHRSPPFLWSWVVGITGTTVTVAFWQALYKPPKVLSQLKLEDYREDLAWVPFGVLVFGLAFSLTLSITVWFVGQFQAQIFALEQAQIKILELNEQLEQMCYIDGLTGIANRRMFDLTVARELRRAYRNQAPVALIVFDIDYFKAYNDCYGHLQGDDCLRQVAQAIQKMARRPTDLAARYGGEEFVLLLPEVPLEAGRMIADDVLYGLQALQIPHERSSISPWVSISAGVASGIPSLNTTVKDLFIQADQALYQAKQQGRNRVVAQAFQTLPP